MLRMLSMPRMRVRTHAQTINMVWQPQQFALQTLAEHLGEGLAGVQLSLPRMLAI